MYETDQPSNEERELERLFADDLGIDRLPSPPEGLAERIKAEIPADLGWNTGAEDVPGDDTKDAPTGVVVPFYRNRGFLALAATVVLAAGLWTLMPRTETGVREDQAPLTHPASGSVPVTEEARDASIPELSAMPAETVAQSVESGDQTLESGDDELKRQVRTRREALQKQLAEVERSPEQDAADGRAVGRVDGDRVGSESGGRAKRVPIPDPTPDEPERLAGAAEREAVEETIVVTGQAPVVDVSRTQAGSVVTSEPVPPTAPRRPRPVPPTSASRPAPPPPPSSSGNAQIEAGNARIAALQEEARKLEKEMRKLDAYSVETDPVEQPASKQKAGELQPPNDEAYDAMFFDSAGVNPFVDTEDDALSTFGLDVDTASYTVMRRYLRDGNLPPKDAVRVEEMLNFFDYGDAPPSAEELESGEFALRADVAPSRWAPGENRSERYYLVRFGLKARDVLATERPPALLTFVVDVSGSMSREDRLGLVKRSLGLLLENLQEEDEVALVVYGSQGRVLLEPTSNHQAVRSAIEQLHTGGSTNAAEGLELGYELTARHRQPGRIHRVILCSDGVANVGTTTSGEGILSAVKRWADQGVELTTVGFGMGNYNDTLMETLADKGNGRYAYVDTLDEARRIFVDDLTGTLTTVAAEARAQVEFDKDVVSRYRLLGYENRDIADERFRDDTVDAGEIGAGHGMTALYEVKTHRPLRKRDRLATLTLRYASIARGEMVEQARSVTGGDAARTFAEAPRALRLAATVAEFAEVLRGSYWAKDVDLGEVFTEAQRVSADWPQGEPSDTDIAEFAALVGKAQRLRSQ